MTVSKSSQKTLKKASTVILARQNNGELQIYILKRSSKSVFMPGMYVFPGGNVSLEDHDPALLAAHSPVNPKTVSRLTGNELTFENIFPFAIAAIRETFEEAGVLISSSNEGNDGYLAEIRHKRISHQLEKDWLQDLIISRRLMLPLVKLSRWSHWITPELMPRRYDTRFFVAALPDGQECTPDNRETTHGIWVTPKEGLSGNLNREIPLSPPTLVTLHELLQYPTLNDLERQIETRQWGDPLFPRLIPSPNGGIIIEPWDPMRYLEIEIDSKNLENKILPVGESFSRIWNYDGIWLPVEI